MLADLPDSLGRFTETDARRAAGPGFRKEHMIEILAALVGVGRITCEEVFVPQAGGNVYKFRYLDRGISTS